MGEFFGRRFPCDKSFAGTRLKYTTVEDEQVDMRTYECGRSEISLADRTLCAALGKLSRDMDHDDFNHSWVLTANNLVSTNAKSLAKWKG